MIWGLWILCVSIVAFLLGWVSQQIRHETSERINLLNDHIRDIEKFVELSQDYWLSRPDPDGMPVDLAAARVRAAFLPIAKFYGDPESDLDQDATLPLYRKLLAAATGGGFETSNRGADPTRAIDVAEIGSEILHLTRVRRRQLSTVRAFAADLRKGLTRQHPPQSCF